MKPHNSPSGDGGKEQGHYKEITLSVGRILKNILLTNIYASKYTLAEILLTH